MNNSISTNKMKWANQQFGPNLGFGLSVHNKYLLY
jgi:hypothetical protein